MTGASRIYSSDIVGKDHDAAGFGYKSYFTVKIGGVGDGTFVVGRYEKSSLAIDVFMYGWRAVAWSLGRMDVYILDSIIYIFLLFM